MVAHSSNTSNGRLGYWVWWGTPETPATGRLRKKGSKFEASLNYMVTKETKFNCKKAHNTARLKMKDLVHGT